MRKVLFCATVESHLLFFHMPYIDMLQREGYEVHVATKLGERKNEFLKKGIKIHDISFDRKIASLDNLKALKQTIILMKSFKFDLVHVHTPIAAFICRFAAKFTNTKYVLYTAHGFHFYKGAPLKNWIVYYTAERIASRWTDGLITINKEDYERAKKFKLRKGGNLYLVNGVGIDTDKYKSISYEEKIEIRKKLEIDEKDFVLITVAELIERKNYKMVFDAIAEIEDRKNIKYLVVGYGDLDGHKEYVKKVGIEENVIFLGYRTDVNELINISDVAVLMSKHEGLPKFILEAITIGKPIIVSDVRGNRDIFQEWTKGKCICIHDIENLKITLKNESENVRNVFISDNSEIKEKYTLDNIKKIMSEIYKTEKRGGEKCF